MTQTPSTKKRVTFSTQTQDKTLENILKREKCG